MTPGATVVPIPVRHRGHIEYDTREAGPSIGVVVPFDFELDWEYWHDLPPDVALYFTRTPFVERPVGLQLARDVGNPRTVARATRALRALDPAVTLYACSSGSFVEGLAGEARLRQAMVDAGARVAITAAGATVDALRHAGVRRVAIATPYSQQLSVRFAGFLEEAGFDVVSVHYLSLTRDISTVSAGTMADLVRQASRPEADAVVLSCTALRTSAILPLLEEQVHCPVFTSNQVALWAALQAASPLAPAESSAPWLGGRGKIISRSTALLSRGAPPQVGTLSAAV